MPETPGFEQMAERIAPPRSAMDPALRWTLVGMIVEHLTIVWNARGAADIDAAKNAENDRHGAPYPDLGAIVADIRSLDR